MLHACWRRKGDDAAWRCRWLKQHTFKDIQAVWRTMRLHSYKGYKGPALTFQRSQLLQLDTWFLIWIVCPNGSGALINRIRRTRRRDKLSWRRFRTVRSCMVTRKTCALNESSSDSIQVAAKLSKFDFDGIILWKETKEPLQSQNVRIC
jgi:hypothetical protein